MVQTRLCSCAGVVNVTIVRANPGCWVAAALLVLANISFPASADSIDQITVQAQRDRLKHEVNTFVSNAIVQSHYDESLERWNNEKVCPLVAGLNKEQGEFILARLSQIVKAAGAPLGSEKCKPNFFAIFSKDPERGLKQAANHHNAAAFNYETGAQLKKFVETPRPVRVWYNAGTTSVDGANLVSAILDSSSVHARQFGSAQGLDPVYNTLPSQYGSRLNASLVTRDILSVIVVVDATKVRELNFGQLSDYIGMIGLAQINLDKDLGEAPTILSIFRDSGESRPKEMTDWDKAMLHALYSTPQRNKMQLSEMQTEAFKEVTAKAQN
jgi:hypothetical protein